MTGPDYLLFDADNHYYETPDCFSRHIESAYADRPSGPPGRPTATGTSGWATSRTASWT